jgi:hypothetical protein
MKPKWFVLIQYWVPQGMGKPELLFPFFVAPLH